MSKTDYYTQVPVTLNKIYDHHQSFRVFLNIVLRDIIQQVYFNECKE